MSGGDKMLRDDELDALFTAAQKHDLGASDDLASDEFMGRLLDDAAEVSASRNVAATLKASISKPGFWTQFTEAIGGWRGGMAITTAMVVGVYVGLADPVGVDTVSGLMSSISGDVAEDEASLYDLLLEG